MPKLSLVIVILSLAKRDNNLPFANSGRIIGNSLKCVNKDVTAIKVV